MFLLKGPTDWQDSTFSLQGPDALGVHKAGSPLIAEERLTNPY